VALALQLFPDLDDAVNGEVVVVHASDLSLKFLVANPACAGGSRLGGVIGRGSKLQGLADRLDSPPALASVDVGDYLRV
jgi:hypothetical protein